jgi:hypothetical protein
MTTYNRVTIVPKDKICTIDGDTVTNMDMSSIPADLHAVQWYGTWGEEEYMDPETRTMPPNVRITSLDAYAQIFAAFHQVNEARKRQEEEETVERTVIEV